MEGIGSCNTMHIKEVSTLEQMTVSEIQQVTVEIRVLKQQTAQNIIEIGKRLKRVKDSTEHGRYTEWLEHEVEFGPRTAQRFIQVSEQFGNATMSSDLSAGKLFELIALPDSVDRQEFIETPHEIPSTGESKSVDEMTVRELREVKQALAKAERERDHAVEQAESLMERDRRILEENERLKREKNPEPVVVEKSVEVVPPDIQRKLESDEVKIKHLKAEYDSLKAELETLRLLQVDDFDPDTAQKQLRRLEIEAETNVLKIKVHTDSFLNKVADVAFAEESLAAASPSTKARISESIKSVELFIAKIKQGINSKIIPMEAQYRRS